MEGPRREAEAVGIRSAHANVAHGVKEKLEIPDAAGEGAEEIIPQHRNAEVIFVNFRSYTAAAVVAAGNRQASVLRARLSGEILVAAFVFEVEHHAPDKIRGEPAQHHDDEAWEAGPEFVGAQRHGGFANRLASGEAEAEARAHHA